MIKEAIQYIVKLGTSETKEINGQQFSTQQLHVINQPTASDFTVRSLSGIVDYVKSNFDGENKLTIHIKSPIHVDCFGPLNLDKRRDHYIEAEAKLPQFPFGRFLDAESFNIAIQSMFQKNDDKDIVLRIVGNIKEENVKSYGDDGVSQSVTAKTGVASYESVLVPNPVTLKPYRTFVEVDQPQSDFVFRMQKGPTCALFEADGGAWELEAMDNIEGYFRSVLDREISSGNVTIIS
jgi:hypothetical protein